MLALWLRNHGRLSHLFNSFPYNSLLYHSLSSLPTPLSLSISCISVNSLLWKDCWVFSYPLWQQLGTVFRVKAIKSEISWWEIFSFQVLTPLHNIPAFIHPQRIIFSGNFYLFWWIFSYFYISTYLPSFLSNIFTSTSIYKIFSTSQKVIYELMQMIKSG